MSYAENTHVPVERSQAEIRKVLAKYHATGFAYAETDGTSMVMFQMCERAIRFNLPMPKKPSQNARAVDVKRYEQLCRSRWRCLVLAIKAKLECVESGITTLEQEFLAHIVLPNRKTVGESIMPQIAASYSDGKMPPLLGYDGV